MLKSTSYNNSDIRVIVATDVATQAPSTALAPCVEATDMRERATASPAYYECPPLTRLRRRWSVFDDPRTGTAEMRAQLRCGHCSRCDEARTTGTAQTRGASHRGWTEQRARKAPSPRIKPNTAPPQPHLQQLILGPWQPAACSLGTRPAPSARGRPAGSRRKSAAPHCGGRSDCGGRVAVRSVGSHSACGRRGRGCFMYTAASGTSCFTGTAASGTAVHERRLSVGAQGQRGRGRPSAAATLAAHRGAESGAHRGQGPPPLLPLDEDACEASPVRACSAAPQHLAEVQRQHAAGLRRRVGAEGGAEAEEELAVGEAGVEGEGLDEGEGAVLEPEAQLGHLRRSPPPRRFRHLARRASVKRRARVPGRPKSEGFASPNDRPPSTRGRRQTAQAIDGTWF